ncbi:MAG: DUF4340 domain-containing protein [Treponema sp.]|jgi:hypothetical protein|nr:DUF4340 domain-containing protein [Treponema sp.]
MAYRRKLLILSSLTLLLSLVYILSLIFDPQRSLSRAAAYAWLDGRLLDQADRVLIRKAGLTVNLLRRNDAWLVSRQGNEYPARQLRVEDLLAALSRRASYPVRAASASSHRQFGLEEGISRITVGGGAGLPLLDLLLGKGGTTGREIYLRKANSDQVRSGEDVFTAYTESPLSSWYDLRLFPDGPEAGDVQRLTVYPPAGGGEGRGYAFTRSGTGWNLRGLDLEPDNSRVESYIRGILSAQGEDFLPPPVPEPFPEAGRLVLELGNGTVLTLSLGEGEPDRYIAKVSGSPHLYALADWTVERLFRDAGYF